MEMKKMEKINNNSFESIKHIDEYGDEYWFARELQKNIGIQRMEKFYNCN